MHKSRGLRISAISAILFAALFIVIVRRSEFSLFAQCTSSSAPVAKDQDLIDAYRHVEVASVSDALEQLTGRRMYMSHKIGCILCDMYMRRPVSCSRASETDATST